MTDREKTPLVLGDVRASPHGDGMMRVVAFDEYEVVYDSWCEGLGWGMTGHSRASYYRIPIGMVLAQPRLRVEPLNEREWAHARPDLPLRLYRSPTLNWADLAASSPGELSEKLDGRDGEIRSPASISAARVTLLFFGPNHSSTVKQTKVEAGADGTIPRIELLWQAGQLFAKEGLEADAGIGFYRAGVYGGLPAYMLLGYHDHAMWAHEFGNDFSRMPRWKMRRKAVAGGYADKLKALKRQLPFKSWREKAEGGLEQYSKENCTAMTRIFDRLIKRLIAVGESAPEQDKVAAFQEAIEATNELNAREMNLIETGEREELCELCNEIARAAGLDPAKYADGEGPASLWRDW